jgi:hypothetical protein
MVKPAERDALAAMVMRYARKRNAPASNAEPVAIAPTTQKHTG